MMKLSAVEVEDFLHRVQQQKNPDGIFMTWRRLIQHQWHTEKQSHIHTHTSTYTHPHTHIHINTYTVLGLLRIFF